MKKLFALLLVFILVFGMVACSNQKPSAIDDKEGREETGRSEEETSSESVPEASYKYDVGDLAPYDEDDWARFGGKIKDVVEYGFDIAFYVGDTLYRSTYDGDYNLVWEEWVIGDDKDVVFAEYGVVIVENPDGSLTAYGSEGCEDGSLVASLQSIDLDCTRENFVYGYHPVVSSNIDVVYFTNAGLMYQQYDLFEQTVSDAHPLLCKVNKTSASVNYFYPDSSGYLVVDDNSYFYETNSNISIDEVAMVFGISSTKIEGVSKAWPWSVGTLLTHTADLNNLYYYDADWKDTDDGIRKLALPEGYTTEDIEWVDAEDNLVIKLKGGPVCLWEASARYSDDYSTSAPATVVGVLDEYIKNRKVVKVFQNDWDLLVLMDDGYIYELTTPSD